MVFQYSIEVCGWRVRKMLEEVASDLACQIGDGYLFSETDTIRFAYVGGANGMEWGNGMLLLTAYSSETAGQIVGHFGHGQIKLVSPEAGV